MLINDEVEGLLPAIPLDGFEDRRAFATPARYPDPAHGFRRCAAREVIRIPPYLVPSCQQRSKISLADPFGPSRPRVSRVSPVEHQETHELRRVFMAKNCPADNNKMPPNRMSLSWE